MQYVFNLGWLRLVKWILIGTVILSAGYILNFILNHRRNSSSIQAQETVQPQTSPQETIEELPVSLEQISAAINQRNIFQAKSAPVMSSDQAAAVPTGELPANLKVVGMLVGHPSQIIIEDTTNRQTYFINEGEVQGGIRLERVDADKFIINYLNQDIAININQSSKGGSTRVNPTINNVQIP